MSADKRTITIGVPCYKAHSTMRRLLSSIRIQSFKDKIEVILVNDDPEGPDYSEFIKEFDDLKIIELKTEVNSGPGVARNVSLQAAKTDAITWIDADDIFYVPYAIEVLWFGLINSERNTRNVMCQGVFVQESTVEQVDGIHKMLVPQQNNLNHPWVFGRLYNTKFLQQNNVDFTDLRAMEDGALNYQVRLLTEGTQFKLKQIPDIVYVWSEGSEHSITRAGRELNNDIPLYNYGNCQLGAILAVKKAIQRTFEKNAFNTNISKFAAETFVGLYYTYFESLDKSPMYSEQLKWLAIWSYHNLLQKYAASIPFTALEQVYMQMFGIKSRELKHFPHQTFAQWYEEISNAELGDIDEIHNKLPQEVRDIEAQTGVFKEPLSKVFADVE